MRTIGLDAHREFAEVAIHEDGLVRPAGRVATSPEALRAFARTLRPTDQVAIEATINTFAIAKLIEDHVARVVVSNPLKTRAIAEAKVKTDKVDARVLAELLAADYLPGVWRPDERLQELRRLVAQRTRIVRERTRLKNQVQGVLHRNSSRAARPRTPSAARAGPGWPRRPCRSTSGWRSTRPCDAWTWPARSSRWSSASWPRVPWPARTRAGS